MSEVFVGINYIPNINHIYVYKIEAENYKDAVESAKENKSNYEKVVVLTEKQFIKLVNKIKVFIEGGS